THQTKEGVAHRVHRLWDRFKDPACGLVRNASEDFMVSAAAGRAAPEKPELYHSEKGTGDPACSATERNCRGSTVTTAHSLASSALLRPASIRINAAPARISVSAPSASLRT